MKTLEVKHIKKKVWHEVADGHYDYSTEESETTFVCELSEIEYNYVANMKLEKEFKGETK